MEVSGWMTKLLVTTKQPFKGFVLSMKPKVGINYRSSKSESIWLFSRRSISFIWYSWMHYSLKHQLQSKKEATTIYLILSWSCMQLCFDPYDQHLLLIYCIQLFFIAEWQNLSTYWSNLCPIAKMKVLFTVFKLFFAKQRCSKSIVCILLPFPIHFLPW